MVRCILPSDLPREYLDALHKFLDMKNALDIEGKHSPKVEDDCWMKTGTVSIYTCRIKPAYVPSGNNWKWAQSKGRKTVPMENENMTIDIFKILPRRKDKESSFPVPSLKLWIFHLRFENKCNSVIWCEKGLDPEPNEPIEEDFTET